MNSRSQSPTGLHSVPGDGGASPVNLNDQYKADALATLTFSSVQDGSRFAKLVADGMIGFRAREDGQVKSFEFYEQGGFWYLREVLSESAETMRQIDADTAKVDRFLAESCEDCGQHVPTEGHSQHCIERAAERERCGYCGQDVCDCKSRYGVVQGIVSAQAKGGR